MAHIRISPANNNLTTSVFFRVFLWLCFRVFLWLCFRVFLWLCFRVFLWLFIAAPTGV
jgi:hypothetical protein